MKKRDVIRGIDEYFLTIFLKGSGGGGVKIYANVNGLQQPVATVNTSTDNVHKPLKTRSMTVYYH